MEMSTLQDLAIHSLKDAYSAENQALKAFPALIGAASHPELKTAFQQHEQETRQQVQRLEQIFQKLGQEPGGVHCKGMEGLIAEAQELIGEDADPDVKDAGLIAAAQKMEHYEIAGYGTACTFAKLMGHTEALALLKQTLNEEETTDKKLTDIAVQVVNPDAAQA